MMFHQIDHATRTLVFTVAITCCLSSAAGSEPPVRCREAPENASCTGRIVCGEPVTSGGFQWSVSLQRLERMGYDHFCGATLVTPEKFGKMYVWRTSTKQPEWLLSAAHCLISDPENLASEILPDFPVIRAVIGRTDLRQPTKNSITAWLHSFCIPKGFNPNRAANDIALIRLTSEKPSNGSKMTSLDDKCWGYNGAPKPPFIGFSKPEIATPEVPVQNLTPDPIRPYTALGISGWGTQRNYPVKTPCHLQRVRLPVIDRKSCEAARPLEDNQAPDESSFCAGFANDPASDCHGDSGGGVIHLNHQRDSASAPPAHLLVGIVANGTQCTGKADSYSVYTDVAQHNRWIKEMLNKLQRKR